MALAYTKAGWNFEKYLYAYEYDIATMQRHFWFGIKDTLVRLGWEVRGGLSSVGLSHNTSEAYGAYSGSDPWPTFDDVHRISTDIYVILRHPSGFEICMGSNYSSGSSSVQYQFMIISYASGFGLANGGADGTGGSNAAAPTATDQEVVQAQNTTTYDNGSYSGGTFGVYGARSDDNLSCRLFVQRQRGVGWWLSLDHLDNAHANLDNSGRVFSHRITQYSEPIDSRMNNDFYTAPLYYGRVSGVNRTFYAGATGYANVGHQSLVKTMSDNKVVVAPMDVYNDTLGEQGYYGTIPDQYWGNNGQFSQLLGDTIGGAPNWFSGGSIITPWDGVTPEPTPRIV